MRAHVLHKHAVIQVLETNDTVGKARQIVVEVRIERAEQSICGVPL